MSCCDSCKFDPCECACEGTRLDTLDWKHTMVGALRSQVDCIRDLNACLGARIHDVRLVRTRWSGGVRGRGVEEVISDEPILPAPLVRDLSGVRSYQSGVGAIERGSVVVSEISLRYTEDELQGNYPGGAPIPPNENFYWEVVNISSGERRRFLPDGPPTPDPLKFEYRIRLTRAQENRSRSGEVRA